MSASDLSLSGSQCRAARALTDVSRAMLSEQSGISEAVIREFEGKVIEPDPHTLSSLRRALEGFGALFIADDETGGHGVRLKFNATESARIERLENEGGPVGEDDVKD